MEKTSQFVIQMLGDFVFSFDGNAIHLERTTTTKTMHALQLLLYHGQEGVTREALMDILYENDPVTDPANNLKVTISNLRQRMRKAGLPQDTTIEYRSGRYYFSTSAQVQLDVAQFEDAVQAARTGNQDALLQAEALYQGDFLPHLVGENWVVVASARYREDYFYCVRTLAAQMEQAGQWELLLPIVTRAAVLYGMEEWQCLRIDCLLNLQRYTEAKRVYDDAVQALAEEFNVKPGAQLVERLRRLELVHKTSNESVGQMAQNLSEQQRMRGAYYCSYPSFIDVYRVCTRMLERTGQSAYMLMCWLVDSRGQLVQDSKKITSAAQKLSRAIEFSLRRGDTYTQHGRDRFLVLLIGTNRENCEVVYNRILYHYKEESERGVSFCYSVNMVGEGALDMLEGSGWHKNN